MAEPCVAASARAQRDPSVDILRGMAIFTMVAANMLPLVEGPYPGWFRFYGTFAAPTFILLAGMMVAMTAQRKGRPFSYYLIRGQSVIIVGILIDTLVWGTWPLMSVDVLYLIGLAIPVVYLFDRIRSSLLQYGIVSGVFLLTPVMQAWLGYRPLPDSFYLSETGLIEAIEQSRVLNNWIVDGWFPVFPWLGFALLGAILARRRQEMGGFANRAAAVRCGLILLAGIVLWNLEAAERLIREGYAELFYPPTYGYMLLTIGLIVSLLCLVDYTHGLLLYAPFRKLGHCSLLMYIVHVIFIGLVLDPLFERWGYPRFGSYLLLYAAAITVLIFAGWGLRKFKDDRPHLPRWVQFLVGG